MLLFSRLSGYACVSPALAPRLFGACVCEQRSRIFFIAMANGLFGEVYNLQAFLQALFGTVVNVQFYQDNSAVLQVLKAGYSARLRHTGRVHKVNVASVSEALEDETISSDHCTTLERKANSFTKIIPPIEWTMALQQLSLNYKS